MVYVQPRICPGKWDAQNLQTDHIISARQPNLLRINKKKRTYRIVDLVVLADLKIKLIANEKRDKYLDFARELNKQWNMKVTVIPIVIGVLGTVTKGLTQ